MTLRDFGSLPVTRLPSELASEILNNLPNPDQEIEFTVPKKEDSPNENENMRFSSLGMDMSSYIPWDEASHSLFEYSAENEQTETALAEEQEALFDEFEEGESIATEFSDCTSFEDIVSTEGDSSDDEKEDPTKTFELSRFGKKNLDQFVNIRQILAQTKSADLLRSAKRKKYFRKSK